LLASVQEKKVFAGQLSHASAKRLPHPCQPVKNARALYHLGNVAPFHQLNLTSPYPLLGSSGYRSGEWGCSPVAIQIDHGAGGVCRKQGGCATSTAAQLGRKKRHFNV
jgi:hypothetical protein